VTSATALMPGAMLLTAAASAIILIAHSLVG